MKTLYKKYQSLFYICIFPYLFVVLFLILPTNKEAITLGSYREVISEDLETSNFYALYVLGWYRTTRFQNIVAESHDLINFYEVKDSFVDMNKQASISKESSLNQSIVASYVLANKVNANIQIDYALSHITLYDALDSLAVGSEIIQIDALDFSILTYEEILDYIRTKIKQEAMITLYTEKVALSIDAKKLLQISFYPFYDIKHKTPDSLPIKTNSGGPSAGMIYTLKQYFNLLEIGTNHLKIAGTGTINFLDENHITIGSIGGLKQKIAALKDADMDILLIPKSHENDDIKAIIKKYIPNTKVYFVSDFLEAVGYIHENL